MDPETLVFFLVYLAYGFLFLNVLTDWSASVEQAGWLSYGASRLAAGDFPYRDFSFAWTPGALLAQWWTESIGCGPRTPALFAAAGSATISFRWAKEWELPPGLRWLLGALLLAWGFSLWNIPHVAWYSTFFVLSGWYGASRQRWVGAGLLLATAFWFQQGAGLWALTGTVAYLTWEKNRAGCLRLSAVFVAAVALPLLAAFALTPDLARGLLAQILAPTPLPMGPRLPGFFLGAPLAALGLWIVSLYFCRTTGRIRALAHLAVLAYGGVGISREGRGFFLGLFFLLFLAAWAVSLLLLLREEKARRSPVLALWLPSLFLAVPVVFAWDFPHVLVLFPVVAPLLLWTVYRVRTHYSWLPNLWVVLPMLTLLGGGLLYQSRVVFFRLYGEKDGVGFVSYGEAHRLNEEVVMVLQRLRRLGAKEGAVVSVRPAAPALLAAGGYREARENDAPEYAVTRAAWPAPEGYALVEKFPYHFSVWKKKPMVSKEP